jgi:hypothetical protein
MLFKHFWAVINRALIPSGDPLGSCSPTGETSMSHAVNQEPAGRKGKLLSGLSLEESIGAEIGPLHNALVGKDESTIFYVDHCDTETLKARWLSDKSVDVTRLHVDAVWGTQTLREAIDRSEMAANQGLVGQKLDFVVASHVVEHVPDLITWLNEIESVLTHDGSVRLAVPDKRYTFDYLRRTSSVTDIVDAFIRRRRVPSGSRVLDFTINMVHVDCAKAWTGELKADELAHGYTIQQALALAEDAESNGTYHDVHCWVFTPMSFAELCFDLASAGFFNFECERLIATALNEFEFFVWMRPSNDKEKIVNSWNMTRQSLRSVDADVDLIPSSGQVGDPNREK